MCSTRRNDDKPMTQQYGLFAETMDDMPLAARFRPRSLDEYLGQNHLLEPGKPLRRAIDLHRLHSMVLWGPPGSGKTTLARLLAHHADAHIVELSAVLAGVKELRAEIHAAKARRSAHQRATVVFIDEIHRFSKNQQDSLLAPVEQGDITLIGATTENPSFELNSALLSRLRVYVLRPLDEATLVELLQQALRDTTRGLGKEKIAIDEELLQALARSADGDARRALNFLQIAVDLAPRRDGWAVIDSKILDEVLQGTLRRFDKRGEAFYDQISALHKAVRGNHPDAALYWYARMLDGGCDPRYIARRVVRIAAEDIGNADPRALPLSVAAWEAYERLGSPEGELAIAQAIVYLAVASKSNAVYVAYKAAVRDAQTQGSLPVPLHLRNAPTQLMKDLGYGKAYRYAHDEPHAHATGEVYFPEALVERHYYFPVERGLEKQIKERLEFFRRGAPTPTNDPPEMTNE